MHSTDSIILKKIDIGEADALISFYTKEFGVVRALAKGIKKEAAKLRGHLEPLSVTRISFVSGKSGERLTHATLLNFWAGIRSDFTKEQIAHYAAEVIREYCLPGEKDENIWNLLLSFFGELDASEGYQAPAGVITNFEIRMLECLGYNGSKDLRVLETTVKNPFCIRPTA